MREVSVAGVGMTPFGKQQKNLKQLAVQAAREAIVDAGIPAAEIDALYIGNFLGGSLCNQQILGSILAGELGLRGVPSMTMEGACASGGIAFRQAYLMVATGVYDTVLVVGVEKMTDSPTVKTTEAINAAMEQGSSERLSGLTFPGFFGLVANRYFHTYGATQEHLAKVVLKNRNFAGNNPLAQFQKPTTLEEILASRPISSPLGLYDCSPISDGACAVLITAEKGEVNVIASAQASGPSQLQDIEDLLTLSAVQQAARQAYQQAGLTPDNIDVAEIHDCFSITEILTIEALGFFEKGEGAEAVKRGMTAQDGRIPVNTSGGLLSKGHPIGATGLAQIYQIVMQLRGTAPNQIPGAKIGLAENLGGTGAYATVHLFEGGRHS